jgi:peptidylprolyl isomerase
MLHSARPWIALALATAAFGLACNTSKPANKKENEVKDAAASAAKSAPTPEPPPRPTIPAPSDVAAAPEDAQKTESGLASKVLTPGKPGDHPRAWDEVTVNYTGWTTDGKMFDSSLVARFPGQEVKPATFTLNAVIPGWTEGVQLMTEGEKRRFWIPEVLAYKGQMGAPSGTLVFDIELVSS